MDDVMLTTYDNSFNPFTEFNRWWKEDLRLGHDCCGRLASVAKTSEVFSDEVNNEIIKEAMQEIVNFEPTIFRIVTAGNYDEVAQ